MSADGQVVVIEFTNYTVELVPAFLQTDDRFKYPDTHDGGSWKYTDPLKEQSECVSCNDKSNGKYFDFCHLIRAWKNEIGFRFGGLLIDTLIYNHFKENDYFVEQEDYYDIFKSILEYMKTRNKEQAYWLAVGSNQQVYNSNNGIFVTKAKKAYNKICNAENGNEDINEVMRELLGSDFPESVSKNYEMFQYCARRCFNDTEEFIDRMFPVDIRYDVSLECKVTQDGWRDNFLSEILRTNGILRKNKKLDFYIESTNCPEPFDIYWKVRNVGKTAEEKDCIRGQIKKTNSKHQKEHTDFQGEHYVECYLIQNNICVGKGHIDVPISTL